ncbi:M48 family metalloprotease [Streptomyces sp. NPDC049597]|uniref:M48 family metalloprotease n=1 Tax=Streptomyces sp. NPDC049597 TaxID=3155276 RepID=UPI00342F46C6
MTAQISVAEQGHRCPECGADVPVESRFVTWCDACDWNVDPGAPAPDPRRIEALRRRLAQRYGERLFADLGPRPGRDVAGVLACALALVVHGVTAALAVTGLLLVVLGWGMGVLPVVGAVLLAIAVALRPRFGVLPDDTPVLRRPDAPRLFELVDEVAAVAGTAGVDTVVIAADANAAVSTYGVRHRRMLRIGLGLWEILTPPQRVALIGHELGHFAHGDTRRGAVVGRALDSLALWLYFLTPDSETDLMQRVTHWMMAVPRWAVLGLLHLLDQLTLRATQRAEYLADETAARAGSSVAAAELLDRLLLVPSVTSALHRESVVAHSRGGAAARREAEQRLWERLAARIESVPEREYKRLRRVSTLRGHCADSTHPPTHLRRRRVSEGTQWQAAVRCDEERAGAIAAELTAARDHMAHVVIRDAAADQ